jgi:hypothetical protein
MESELQKRIAPIGGSRALRATTATSRKGEQMADRADDAAQDVMNAIQRSHGENCLSIADRRRKTLV